jgi:hypothetical protein
MRKIVLFISLIASLAITVYAQPAATDTAGFHLQFIDLNHDGINDNYQNFVSNNPIIVAHDSTIFMEYKYQYGTGYGYGFTDRDGNGTNDLLDSLPGLNILNPTIKTTRLGGLEVIKHANIRHGEISRPQMAIQREAEHYLYNGHCSNNDSLYSVYRQLDPIE